MDLGWRAIAERCETLTKGSAVRIEGRLRSWQSENGKNGLEVQADLLEVLKEKPTPMKTGAQEPEQKEMAAA